MKGGNSKISIVDSKDFDVRIKTNINGENIIEMTIDGCQTYFYDRSNSYDYIILIHKEAGPPSHYVYRMMKISSKLYEDNPLYQELRENMSNPNPILKRNSNIIKKIDVDSYLKFKHKFCSSEKNVDLSKARSMLDNFTKLLLDKPGCKHLKLGIDFVYNMEGRVALFSESEYNAAPTELLLCLYNRGQCISSIEILKKEKSDMVEINSKTFQEFEGRKYNKLLRAITIIIIQSIYPECRMVLSDAANVISAILLITSFKGIVSEEVSENMPYFRFMKDKYPGADPSNPTRDMLKHAYVNHNEVKVSVILDKRTITNAYKQFHIVQHEMTKKCIQEEKVRHEMAATRIQKHIRSRIARKRVSTMRSRSRRQTRTMTKTRPHSFSPSKSRTRVSIQRRSLSPKLLRSRSTRRLRRSHSTMSHQL